jgi:hypothetical protein
LGVRGHGISLYHHSFQVNGVQSLTREVVQTLKSLSPVEAGRLNADFEEIINSGACEKEFDLSHNEAWTANTRVFLEAFFTRSTSWKWL